MVSPCLNDKHILLVYSFLIEFPILSSVNFQGEMMKVHAQNGQRKYLKNIESLYILEYNN